VTPAAAEVSKTVVTQTPQEFSRKLGKNSSERQKIVKKSKETELKSPIFPIDFSRTIGSPMFLVKNNN
jgi:hypothetical protein